MGNKEMQVKHCIVAYNKSSQSYQCLKGDRFLKAWKRLTHIDQIHETSKITSYPANALMYKIYVN